MQLSEYFEKEHSMIIQVLTAVLIAQDVPISGPPGMANSGNGARWTQNGAWTHQHVGGPVIGACRVDDDHDDMLFSMLSVSGSSSAMWLEERDLCDAGPFMPHNNQSRQHR